MKKALAALLALIITIVPTAQALFVIACSPVLLQRFEVLLEFIDGAPGACVMLAALVGSAAGISTKRYRAALALSLTLAVVLALRSCIGVHFFCDSGVWAY